MKKNLMWTIALSILSISNAMADCEVKYDAYQRSDGTVYVQASPKKKSNCTGNVVIEEKVTLYGTTYDVSTINNFRDLTGITSVTIKGNAMKEIGNSAFNGCTGLKTINLPDSITNIDSYAFKDSGLEMSNLKLPSSLTTIGQEVFIGTNITGSLVIPENVTSIDMYAFYGVTGITDVTLTNTGSTNIGWSVFSNTGKVTINGNIMGSDGFKNSNITELEISEGVTNLGSHEFSNCSNLTTIIIPDSLNLTENPYFPAGATFYMSEAKKEQCSQNPVSCGFTSSNFNTRNIQTIPDYTYDSQSNLYKSGNLYYQSLSDIINQKPYSPTVKEPDGFGHYKVFDKTTGQYLGMVDANGNPWKRRIYTVEEANQAAGTKNRVSIRYK